MTNHGPPTAVATAVIANKMKPILAGDGGTTLRFTSI